MTRGSNLERSTPESSDANNMRTESALAYTPESKELYKRATDARNSSVTCIPTLIIEDCAGNGTKK